MDFKTLYSDSLLKPYFLKWLRINEYDLYFKGKNPLRLEGKYIPDPGFVVMLPYPESYETVKKWYESGNNYWQDILNYTFLGMNDPDAEKRFDAEINKELENHPSDTVLCNIKNKLSGLCTPYSIGKVVKLLESNIEFTELIKGKPRFSFRCALLSNLENSMAIHGVDIPVTIYNTDEIRGADDIDTWNYRLKKHLPEIKVLAEKLKTKIRSEQLYWMKDMPFYKGI